MKRYLFLVTERYGFSILRPLQDAILRRNGRVAWFFDKPGLSDFLLPGEEMLRTAGEVVAYDPLAVFTAGNHMYHFFPGIKVQVFHGYAVNKRAQAKDDHFTIRGWFDLYCVNDAVAWPVFQQLEGEYGNFAVALTGWTKLDGFFDPDRTIPLPENDPPVIIYSSTFTERITSTPYLFDEISRLVRERDWRWIITFHPKMASETVEKYRALTEYPNVTFYDGDNNVEVMRRADVMLCDSSSIIFEFMYFDKPVVTFRNTCPGDYLLDISDPALLEGSLEVALTRPADLMERVRAEMNKRHPWRDGRSSERVLDAVDDFAANRQGRLKKKKISLMRRYKARKKLGYYKWKNEK